MEDKAAKCMVCGKPVDGGGSVCQACQESIRSEAVGKQKKIVKNADKAIKKTGGKSPS